MHYVKPAWRDRMKLRWGVCRRMIWHLCRPGYVRAQLAQRQGACRRCGACCRLGRLCPYLMDDHGLSACQLYGRYRLPNCVNFPIDARDLADRDLIAPNEPCGYSFTRRVIG